MTFGFVGRVLALIRKETHQMMRDKSNLAVGLLLLGGMAALPWLLGLVLGLVTGAFDCWLLALLLWFAASITTGQIDWLTTGVLQRSVGYSLFGAFNPFLLHY